MPYLGILNPKTRQQRWSFLFHLQCLLPVKQPSYRSYQDSGGILIPTEKARGQLSTFPQSAFSTRCLFLAPPPAPRRCLSRTYLGSSGCFSTYSTVLLRVLSPIPVAALTTLIPICASNPDLSLALDSYFSLDASTPESLRHKHLYLTSTSHGKVTFNFPLSIISHSHLVTENQQSCHLNISCFPLHCQSLSLDICSSLSSFYSSLTLNRPLHLFGIIFLTLVLSMLHCSTNSYRGLIA